MRSYDEFIKTAAPRWRELWHTLSPENQKKLQAPGQIASQALETAKIQHGNEALQKKLHVKMNNNVSLKRYTRKRDNVAIAVTSGQEPVSVNQGKNVFRPYTTTDRAQIVNFLKGDIDSSQYNEIVKEIRQNTGINLRSMRKKAPKTWKELITQFDAHEADEILDKALQDKQRLKSFSDDALTQYRLLKQQSSIEDIQNPNNRQPLLTNIHQAASNATRLKEPNTDGYWSHNSPKVLHRESARIATASSPVKAIFQSFRNAQHNPTAYNAVILSGKSLPEQANYLDTTVKNREITYGISEKTDLKDVGKLHYGEQAIVNSKNMNQHNAIFKQSYNTIQQSEPVRHGYPMNTNTEISQKNLYRWFPDAITLKRQQEG